MTWPIRITAAIPSYKRWFNLIDIKNARTLTECAPTLLPMKLFYSDTASCWLDPKQTLPNFVSSCTIPKRISYRARPSLSVRRQPYAAVRPTVARKQCAGHLSGTRLEWRAKPPRAIQRQTACGWRSRAHPKRIPVRYSPDRSARWHSASCSIRCRSRRKMSLKCWHNPSRRSSTPDCCKPDHRRCYWTSRSRRFRKEWRNSSCRSMRRNYSPFRRMNTQMYCILPAKRKQFHSECVWYLNEQIKMEKKFFQLNFLHDFRWT